MQAIRPYVNFNYDLREEPSDYAKKKIKLYFDEIEALKARNHVVYRPRKKELLKPAQQFAQHERYLPGLRAAFVPVANPHVAKFKVGRGKKPTFQVKELGIARHSLFFNPKKLVRDTAGHIAELLATEKAATHFAVMAGKFEISAALSRERVTPRVVQLMERYSEGGRKFKKWRRSSNHWKEWMHGLNVYTFPDQADPLDYMQAKKERATLLKARNRKAKRRNKR